MPEEGKPSMLAITWDFWSLWSTIPLLAKQAEAGSKVSVISMNLGSVPEKPIHGLPVKGEWKPAFGGYISACDEFKAAFEAIGIDDVRCLSLMPLSRFAGMAQKAMLKVTRIIRELKPDIILTEDGKNPDLPGWYSWYCAMIERAIYEAGSPWHTSHDARYPIPNPYMQAIELKHYDLKVHKAKEEYLWGSKEVNYVVDVSDMVDAMLRFTEKVHYFKGWKPPRMVPLKRLLGPVISQYLDDSQLSMHKIKST